MCASDSNPAIKKMYESLCYLCLFSEDYKNQHCNFTIRLRQSWPFTYSFTTLISDNCKTCSELLKIVSIPNLCKLYYQVLLHTNSAVKVQNASFCFCQTCSISIFCNDKTLQILLSTQDSCHWNHSFHRTVVCRKLCCIL